jgi:hypothetical protein
MSIVIKIDIFSRKASCQATENRIMYSSKPFINRNKPNTIVICQNIYVKDIQTPIVEQNLNNYLCLKIIACIFTIIFTIIILVEIQ